MLSGYGRLINHYQYSAIQWRNAGLWLLVIDIYYREQKKWWTTETPGYKKAKIRPYPGQYPVEIIRTSVPGQLSVPPLDCTKVWSPYGDSFQEFVEFITGNWRKDLMKASRYKWLLGWQPAFETVGTCISSVTPKSHLCFTSITLFIYVFLPHSHVFQGQ